MPTDWTPTQWRTPESENNVRVRFRNGEVSKHTHRPDQLNWRDRNYDFDIIEWREE